MLSLWLTHLAAKWLRLVAVAPLFLVCHLTQQAFGNQNTHEKLSAPQFLQVLEEEQNENLLVSPKKRVIHPLRFDPVVPACKAGTSVALLWGLWLDTWLSVSTHIRAIDMKMCQTINITQVQMENKPHPALPLLLATDLRRQLPVLQILSLMIYESSQFQQLKLQPFRQLEFDQTAAKFPGLNNQLASLRHQLLNSPMKTGNHAMVATIRSLWRDYDQQKLYISQWCHLHQNCLILCNPLLHGNVLS